MRLLWWPALLAGGLSAAGLVFQRQGARRDARRFPAPGRLVETQAGSFHLHETPGPPGPAVLLESGLAGSSLSWAYVHEQVAEFTSVCSYDRAGFGWSGPAQSPRTLETLVEELRMLLQHCRFAPPFILVGHSFGGLLVRGFAHAYPDLTAGIVLVDPVSTGHWAACGEQEQRRLRRGIRLARRGALLARFGFIRLILMLLVAGRSLLPQSVARLTARGALPFLERVTREVQQLPPSLWPVVRAQWSRPMGFAAISAYLSALPDNCKAAEASCFASAVPTIILSASTATGFELAERARWLTHSRDGGHRRISDSGHWIQVERPGAVIAAIREVVNKVKQQLYSPYVPERV